MISSSWLKTEDLLSLKYTLAAGATAVVIYILSMLDCGPLGGVPTNWFRARSHTSKDLDEDSKLPKENLTSSSTSRKLNKSTRPHRAQEKEAMATKKVYLIRHAESAENRRMASFAKSLHDVASFSIPSKEDVKSSFELLDVKAQIDSDVSDKGRAQIKQLGQRLRNDNFVTNMHIQLVAHSPLKRARQTSEGMLGCVTRNEESENLDSSWEGMKAETVGRVVELPCLSERTIFEWMPIHHDSFMERIKEFEVWLSEQPEERIAIVGHSQYFKSMLAMSYKFGNCDVWELTFDPSGGEHDLLVEVDVNTNGAVRVIKENQASGIEAVRSTDEGISTTATILPRGWSGLKNLYSYDQS